MREVELTPPLDDRSNHRRDTVVVGHVAGDVDALTATVADLRGRGLAALRVEVGDGDARARIGEREC